MADVVSASSSSPFRPHRGGSHSESVARAGDSAVCLHELEHILEADSHSHICPGTGVPAGAHTEGLFAGRPRCAGGLKAFLQKKPSARPCLFQGGTFSVHCLGDISGAM